MADDNMVQLAMNTIRTLSIDAIQAAKSGHPGTPMSLAPLVYAIWNRVLRVGGANDIDRIEHALAIFRLTKGRPTFIVLDSHIGYGSPHKQDTPETHGEPLGDDESASSNAITAGPKTRSSSCQRAFMTVSSLASANGATRLEMNGRNYSTPMVK